MTRMKAEWRWACALVACVLLAGLGVSPGFAQSVTKMKPDDSGWVKRVWAGSGETNHEVVDGRRVLRVDSREGGDLAWSFDAEVEPGSVYRLSGKIRTRGVEPGTGVGALFNIGGLSGARTGGVSGTMGWTDQSVVFRTGDRTEVQVNCLFGGWGQSTGTAWYDDVRLERIDTGNLERAVTVHAGEARPEMSPLIYAQFIEHMGRCIYGGIWAEMLEDRKFYYTITEKYDPYTRYTDTAFPVVGRSPWKITGKSSGVKMTDEDVFVGDHTPVVMAGSGISQHDLALVEGRTYDGYVWLKAMSGSPVVRVGLTDAGQDQTVRGIGKGGYEKHAFSFRAGASTEEATLSLGVSGGDVLVGTVSLMPADNVGGMRADTLELLKKLDSPLYRWPGGNFVSGYDWRDGIGDRDRRPPRTNPAWTGIEPNDFGMHEFIAFCEHLDTEPLITMNMGFEGAFSAEAEMEYANGTEGYWAEKRAENGSSEPFGVKYWCIGNEMWGDWQLGFMSPDDYQKKNNWVVKRLRQKYPDFVALASGNAGSWSKGLLEHSADYMDMIAEHFYDQRRDDVAEHVRLVPQSIREKVEFHRSVQGSMANLNKPGEERRVPIAMTEWNYWYGPYLYGELGTVYYLRDALGIAAGLNEYSRSTDIVQAAFYAQTVNVIGAIKTTQTDAFLAATALPLIMYRAHFGTLPVEVDLGEADLLGYDVAAAWTEDRSAMTFAIVNANAEPVTITLRVEGFRPASTAQAWRFGGEDPDAYNDAEHERLAIESLGDVPFGETVTVPGYSSSIYRVDAR